MSSLPERLSQIKARVEKAHRHICDLAAHKANFEMSIPVQPYDSDMVLQAPLDDIPDLVAALEVAIEALKYVRRVTYGTEICNSDAENNEILAGHYFNSANNARDALAKIEKLMGDQK